MEIISPGCKSSFRPSAATNQQNSLTYVVLLSQILIIAIMKLFNQPITTIRLMSKTTTTSHSSAIPVDRQNLEKINTTHSNSRS